MTSLQTTSKAQQIINLLPSSYCRIQSDSICSYIKDTNPHRRIRVCRPTGEQHIRAPYPNKIFPPRTSSKLTRPAKAKRPLPVATPKAVKRPARRDCPNAVFVTRIKLGPGETIAKVKALRKVKIAGQVVSIGSL